MLLLEGKGFLVGQSKIHSNAYLILWRGTAIPLYLRECYRTSLLRKKCISELYCIFKSSIIPSILEEKAKLHNRPKCSFEAWPRFLGLLHDAFFLDINKNSFKAQIQTNTNTTEKNGSLSIRAVQRPQSCVKAVYEAVNKDSFKFTHCCCFFHHAAVFLGFFSF